jgi:hypothetical protein
VQSTRDECLFFYEGNYSSLPKFVFVYVDDMLLVSNNNESLDHQVQSISENYAIKDLGDPKHLIGIQVERNEKSILLSQEAYSRSLIERFLPTEANTVESSLSDDANSHIQSEPLCEEQSTIYRSIVGSIGYLSSCTRQYLAVPFSILGSRASKTLL